MRTLRRLLAVPIIPVAAWFSIGVAPVAADSGSEDAIATYKTTHDADPHVALPATVAMWAAQKSQLLSGAPMSLPNTYLVANQQAQQTYYYCGPASVAEALGARSVSISQASAASLLKTNASTGTAWSGVNANVPNPTGYPIPDVLNYKLNTTWYIPVALPYTPSSNDVANYKSALGIDIVTYGWAMVGDAWEVPGGPHLVGHPPNLEIHHWFEIRGYVSNGATTGYEDSVHGASSISWSPDVPAYSNYSSSILVTIMGGRGYVW